MEVSDLLTATIGKLCNCRIIVWASVLMLILNFKEVENSQSRILLRNNGYSGLVVAVSRDLPENHWPSLRQSIIEMLTDGSQSLYEATDYRLYLKEVFLLVPATWNVNYPEATWQSWETADVLINKYKNNAVKDPYGHSPYVRHYRECGKPGDYIHYTRDYLRDPSVNQNYGKLGRVFTHEFLHFRFGVFDEYPPLDENGNPKWFQQNGDSNFCISDVNIVTIRGQSIPFPNKAEGSIMAFTTAVSVGKPCHHTGIRRHNQYADNRQNKRNGCDGQSVLDVMLKHKDLAGNVNMPNTSVNTVPKFTILKAKPRCVIFVLDTSGSMEETVDKTPNRPPKITLALEAIRTLLLDESLLPSGIFVGMVSFSLTAKVMFRPTEIKSMAIRQSLVKNVTARADGSTAIGKGVLLAKEIAADVGVAGAEAIVLTDGHERVDPKIPEIADDVVDSGLIVHSILYSNMPNAKFHTLPILSRKTGGKQIVEDGMKDAGLFDAFRTFFKCDDTSDGGTCSRAAKLGSDSQMMPPLGKQIGDFVVDEISDVKVIINVKEIGQNAEALVLTAISPSGLTYTESVAEISESNDFMIRLELEEQLEEGKWRYEIQNKVNKSRHVQAYIGSVPFGNKPVLYVKIWTDITDVVYGDSTSGRLKLYARVMQDKSPVLGAQVIADLNKTMTKQLRDNGAGADVVANDGVYSGYFLNLTANGVLTFDVIASNTHGTATTQVAGKTGAFPLELYLKDPSAVDFLKPKYKNSPRFHRQESGGYVMVSGVPDILPSDLAQPSDIVDLSGKVVSHEKKILRLQWTASGDDLDEGTATAYDLRYSYESTALDTAFDDADKLEMNETWSPMEAGQSEIKTIEFTEVRSAFVYIGMKVLDDIGRSSDISNIIRISFEPTHGNPPNTEEPRSHLWILYVTVGVGIVFVVVCIISGILLAKRHKKWCFKARTDSGLEIGGVITDNGKRDTIYF